MMRMDLHGERRGHIPLEYVSLDFHIMSEEEYKKKMEELISQKKSIGSLFLYFLNFSLVSLYFLIQIIFLFIFSIT